MPQRPRPCGRAGALRHAAVSWQRKGGDRMIVAIVIVVTAVVAALAFFGARVFPAEVGE